MRSGHPAFRTISSQFQTQVHSIVACPEVYPLSPGFRQVPPGTTLNSSNTPSITSSICRRNSTCELGTPAFLAISNRFQKKVHFIVASPEINPLSPWCLQVFLGSSFHSSHKPSITSSICRSTSTCELGTPAFLAISSRFKTQVHSILASLKIYPLSPGSLQVLLGTSFHSSHKPSITSSIFRSTSICEVGPPPFWPFPVGSRHKSTQ